MAVRGKLHRSNRARQFNAAQREWCKRYLEVTGFEPTIDNDTQSPFEVFMQDNLCWFGNWAAECIGNMEEPTRDYLKAKRGRVK